MSLSTPYKYDPLPKGRWIRLLELHPGEYDDPINFELTIVEHQHAPEYEAISYAWGDPKITSQVLCEGRSLHVTINLVLGLRRLRHKDQLRMLWADAICIDQSNDPERGHQVAFMRDIYGQARTVLSWLGEVESSIAEQCESLVMDYTSFIQSELEQLSPDDFLRIGVAEIHNVDEFSEDERSLMKDLRWQAFATMMDCSYFKRLWILQEIGIAKTVVVLYGTCSRQFSHVIQIMITVYNRCSYAILKQYEQSVGRSIGCMSDMHMTFLRCWQGFSEHDTWIQESPILRHLQSLWTRIDNSRVLMMLLDRGRDLKASDPRDHVFALLGHPAARASDGSGCIVNPDYALDTLSIYKDLVLQYATNYRSLDILCAVSHNLSQDLDDGPSWIAKWHIPPKTLLVLNLYAVMNKTIHKRFMRVSCQQNSLEVSGIVFDSVKAYSRIFDDDDWYHDKSSPAAPSNRRQHNPVQTCWSIVKQHGICKRALPHTVVSQIFRTLMVGPVYDPEAERANFKAYCAEFCNVVEYQDLLITCQRLNSSRHGNAAAFQSRMGHIVRRRFFVTCDDEMGLCPAITQPGDLCCMLFGCAIPFIIRPTGVNNQFKLVGVCYMPGPSEGEIVEQWLRERRHIWKKNRLRRQKIVLV